MKKIINFHMKIYSLKVLISTRIAIFRMFIEKKYPNVSTSSFFTKSWWIWVAEVPKLENSLQKLRFIWKQWFVSVKLWTTVFIQWLNIDNIMQCCLCQSDFRSAEFKEGTRRCCKKMKLSKHLTFKFDSAETFTNLS